MSTEHTEANSAQSAQVTWLAGTVELLVRENDQLRAALREIIAYQGFYATDANPTIRKLKKIASDALGPVTDDPKAGA